MRVMKINRRKFETISQGRFFHPKSQDIFYFLDNILLFEFDLEFQVETSTSKYFRNSNHTDFPNLEKKEEKKFLFPLFQ